MPSLQDSAPTTTEEKSARQEVSRVGRRGGPQASRCGKVCGELLGSGLAADAIYFLGLCFVFLIRLKTQNGNCCWFRFITVKLHISFREHA